MRQQRESLSAWVEQRLKENAFLSKDGSFGGLRGDSPLFLSKKGQWRKFAFNVKKYKTESGVKETMVCASLENTVREIIKRAGFQGGSSHSGRRSLASLMNSNKLDLELIQIVLGHESEEMTLEYIDPNLKLIDAAFKALWKGVKQPTFSDGDFTQ